MDIKVGSQPSTQLLKIEQSIRTGPTDTTIVLIDIAKAFDNVNRQLLWTTQYKTGLPHTTIKRIKHGHQNTKLRCNDNGEYGPPIINNVGVFQ